MRRARSERQGYARGPQKTRHLTSSAPVRLGADNLQRLLAALRGLDPVHRMAEPPIPFEHDAATLASFRNLYLRTKLGQLDCLGEVLGVGDFNAVSAHSETIDLNGVPCRVMTLDALIAAKSAMNRDRDILAAAQLRAIKARREQSRVQRGAVLCAHRHPSR